MIIDLPSLQSITNEFGGSFTATRSIIMESTLKYRYDIKRYRYS